MGETEACAGTSIHCRLRLRGERERGMESEGQRVSERKRTKRIERETEIKKDRQTDRKKDSKKESGIEREQSGRK